MYHIAKCNENVFMGIHINWSFLHALLFFNRSMALLHPKNVCFLGLA
jgi:hypothetical protein